MKKTISFIFAILLPYSAGVIFSSMRNTMTFSEAAGRLLCLRELPGELFLILLCIAMLLCVYELTERFIEKRKLEDIMLEKTPEFLRRADTAGLSWGFQKTMLMPENGEGWDPTDMHVDLQDSRLDKVQRFRQSTRLLNSRA